MVSVTAGCPILVAVDSLAGDDLRAFARTVDVAFDDTTVDQAAIVDAIEGVGYEVAG